MPRQIAKTGSVFLIPLDDGTAMLAQIVEIVPQVLNSITIAVFDRQIVDLNSLPKLVSLENEKIISCQFVTRDLFSNGVWRQIARVPVDISGDRLPYRDTEKNRWIGAKVIGSGIIRSFLSAYQGLRPWNEMLDPGYYTKLLLPGVPVPSTATTSK
jgi:hypothetical protein